MESSSALHVEAQSLLICIANYLSLGQFELAWVCLQELCGYDEDLAKKLLLFLASSGTFENFAKLSFFIRSRPCHTAALGTFGSERKDCPEL